MKQRNKFSRIHKKDIKPITGILIPEHYHATPEMMVNFKEKWQELMSDYRSRVFIAPEDLTFVKVKSSRLVAIAKQCRKIANEKCMRCQVSTEREVGYFEAEDSIMNFIKKWGRWKE